MHDVKTHTTVSHHIRLLPLSQNRVEANTRGMINFSDD